MTTYNYTNGGSVNSSAMTNVWYDQDTSTLYICFKNGTLAAYDGVSSSTYYAFIESDSLGKFYRNWIQGRFNGVTVDQHFRFEQRREDDIHDTASAGQKFTIVYDRTVTEEYESSVYANSVEDALRQFNNEMGKCDEGESVRIKKVAIHFD